MKSPSKKNSYGQSLVKEIPIFKRTIVFDLSKKENLQLIILSPAEILGESDKLGSLKIERKSTIVVSTRNIMDILRNDIWPEFIEGRMLNLNDRHKNLQKTQRKNILILSLIISKSSLLRRFFYLYLNRKPSSISLFGNYNLTTNCLIIGITSLSTL